MTQEEKQLLLTDISARIPYRLKFFVDNTIPPLPSSEDYKHGKVFSVLTATGLDVWEDCIFTEETGMDCVLFVKRNGKEIQVLKPYLRPKSSMTTEEYKEYDSHRNHISDEYNRYCFDTAESIDWLNANHFDYRELIPMGLALEAPEEMYK